MLDWPSLKPVQINFKLQKKMYVHTTVHESCISQRDL